MSVADILIGPVRVFYAPLGEALPDENSVSYGGDWAGSWTEIAMTKEPLSMNRDVTTFDSMIEQSTLPVKRSVTEEKVAYETVLAELKADYLAVTMEGTVTTTAAGAGQVGKEELVAGGQVKLTERTWGFEALYVDASDNQLPVRFQIWRATAVLNGQLTFGKGDSTGIPLRIDSLGDLTQPVGQQLFKMVKVTAPATS